MATNGNDQNMLDPRQLMGRMPAPAAGHPKAPTAAPARLPPAPDNGVGDVLEYVREHEKYMGQSAHELTQAIEVHVANYLGRMRQRLAELERVIGLRAPRGGGDDRGT